MLKATYMPYRLRFKEAGGTSRGVLTHKDTYFIKLWDSDHPLRYGVGEAALFRGLSADDRPEYEEILSNVCRNVHLLHPDQLEAWSSIRFGLECALLDLQGKCERTLFDTPFAQGKQMLPINGLIWMGTQSTMRQRLAAKLEEGYRCIKLKIGAIDFDAELELLSEIRRHFSSQQVELRVDANGAFTPEDALEKLKRLAHFDIHSIEQPIRAGRWEEMAQIVSQSPIPVALDEELIGIDKHEEKIRMLDTIHPHYIILKPSLCGSFTGASEWIALANERNIGNWVTSALESNIGLNAIAQWCSTLRNSMPQGLGTGQLYTNNISSPLYLQEAAIGYDPDQCWDLSLLQAWK